jgi:hypothetical protein
MMSDITPEEFSRITCADLKLPAEMEPIISYKIREIIFRTLFKWMDDSDKGKMTIKSESKIDSTQPDSSRASDIKINLISPHEAIDTVISMWKKSKPSNADEINLSQQPLLPQHKDSNIMCWKSI